MKKRDEQRIFCIGEISVKIECIVFFSFFSEAPEAWS